MKFRILGMHCASCKNLIIDVLEELGVGIVSFTFNEKQKEGILEVSSGDSKTIIEAIMSEGPYRVEQL